MCRVWIGSSKLTTELHKEALNSVSRVDLRTSQFGTQVVELGATRHLHILANLGFFQKGIRQIRLSFKK